MKYLIVLLAVISLACADWTPRNREDFFKDRDECLTSEKISHHCAHMIKSNEYPNDPGCYYRCIGLKAGIWDDTNGYNLDRSLEQISFVGLQATKEDYSKCLSDDYKDADPCKWAASINKCIWDNKYVTKKN